MFKKTTILVLTSCFSFLLHAQYDNVWTFGPVGLDFNEGSPPEPILIGSPSVSTLTEVMNMEGSASVCNVTGELQFSTNGNQIWNRNGNIMSNGDSLVDQFDCISSAQGALIVPFPNDTAKHYVFSLTFPEGYLFYSIVDMSLNGGLGEVVAGQKGILIDSGFTEQMTSVVGEACNIWVVLCPKRAAGDSVTFNSYEISSNGLNTVPVISKAGVVPGSFFRNSYLCFSPDRSLLALTRDAIITGSLELYDFDPMTAQVSNQRLLNPNLNIADYSVCFSPDNSKLYVNGWNNGIRQYDLSSNNLTTIVNSAQVVDSLLRNDHPVTGLKLGPEGKIYYNGQRGKAIYVNIPLAVRVYQGISFGAINFPNLVGSAVQAQDSVVSFGLSDTIPFGADVLFPLRSSLGFPNIISIIQPDTVFTSLDTQLCANENSLSIESPLEGATYLWDNGTVTRDYMVTGSGVIWVRSSNYCHFRVDTFNVELVDLSPIIRVDEFELSTTRLYDSYQWYLNGNIIQGATSSTYLVTENGNYTVVVSADGCTDTSDIFEVNNTAIPNFELENLINIYPNPTQDLVYIRSTFKVNVKITSIEGKLIKQVSNAEQVSLRGVADGIYLLHITDTNGAVLKVEKVIKSK